MFLPLSHHALRFSLSFSVIWRPGWNYDNKRKEKLLPWLLSHYVNDIKQTLCVCVCVWFLSVYSKLISWEGCFVQTHLFVYTKCVCVCVILVGCLDVWTSCSSRGCLQATGANLHTVITRCQLHHTDYDMLITCCLSNCFYSTYIKEVQDIVNG